MAAVDDMQERPCITNSFTFTKDVYKEIFPYTPGNNYGQIMRTWAKGGVAMGAITTPIALLFLWFYIDTGYQSIRGLYALIPITLVAVFVPLCIYQIKNWNRPNWNRRRYRKLISNDLSRLQKGLALICAVKVSAIGSKYFGDPSKYASFPDEYDPTREYEFSARICDDEIYVGKSNRKAVSNFQQDVVETYQSDSYYGIRCRGGEDIIFDKNAFGRYKLWMVDEFVNMKRKGQQISLADYEGRLKEKVG